MADSPQIEPRNIDGYIPELDGLRAVAVALVFWVHLDISDYVGNFFIDAFIMLGRVGWIGVDLFFVLSGFLITSILLKTRDSPGYFRKFYFRRILRIMPLYYAFLAFHLFCVPLVPALVDLLQPQYLSNKPSQQVFYWFFLSNFSEGLGFTKNPYLTLCWSLAVEEHFYLIWPAIVFQYRDRILSRICIGLIAFSFLTRFVLMTFLHANVNVIQFTTPIRFDGLALGSLFAIWLRNGAVSRDALRTYARWAVPLGILSLPFAAYLQEGHTVINGVYVGQYPPLVIYGFLGLALFFGAIMLKAVLEPGGWFARLMRSPLLVRIGQRSFCIYLIHETIGQAFRNLLRRHLEFDPYARPLIWIPSIIAVALITWGVAEVSWYLLERPFLRLKRHFRYATATPSRPLE